VQVTPNNILDYIPLYDTLYPRIIAYRIMTQIRLMVLVKIFILLL